MFIWIFPQKNAAVTKPAGEWNESRIKQVNGKIEFYLNGVLTAEQDLTSKEWKDLVAKSNFKYFATFGKTVKDVLLFRIGQRNSFQKYQNKRIVIFRKNESQSSRYFGIYCLGVYQHLKIV
jgi:hypothetical protein